MQAIYPADIVRLCQCETVSVFRSPSNGYKEAHDRHTCAVHKRAFICMSVNGTAYRPFGEVKLIGDNEPGSAVETSRWAVG